MVRLALLLLALAACGAESEPAVGVRPSEPAAASAAAAEPEPEPEPESRCLPVELCGCPLGCTSVTGATAGARVRGEAGLTCGMDHEVLELSTPDGPALVLQPIAPEGARCARQCRARRRGPSACTDRCEGCHQPNRELWYWPPESSG